MNSIILILGIVVFVFIVLPIIGFILELLGIGFNIIWYFIVKSLKFIVWIIIILLIIVALS